MQNKKYFIYFTVSHLGFLFVTEGRCFVPQYMSHRLMKEWNPAARKCSSAQRI